MVSKESDNQAKVLRNIEKGLKNLVLHSLPLIVQKCPLHLVVKRNIY